MPEILTCIPKLDHSGNCLKFLTLCIDDLIIGYRYPKPGTPNPTVKLRVADLAEPKSIRTRDLTPPPFLMNE